MFLSIYLAKCIDHYTKLKVHNEENPESPKPIDPRLEAIVNRMFQRYVSTLVADSFTTHC